MPWRGGEGAFLERKEHLSSCVLSFIIPGAVAEALLAKGRKSLHGFAGHLLALIGKS
jgi:hypothetical protein